MILREELLEVLSQAILNPTSKKSSTSLRNWGFYLFDEIDLNAEYKLLMMLHFKYSSLIDAPVEMVWKFYQRPNILEILTPPWQPVEIVRHEGGLEVGAISEFRIHLGFLPVRWVAQHTECKSNQLFTDEQVAGPMQSWVHRHQFVEENGKTRLTDAISFSLPGGSPIEWLLSAWVDERLEHMFRYRHQVTKRECEQVLR